MGIFSRKSKAEKVADTVKGKAAEVAQQSMEWVSPHVEELQKRVEKQVIPAVKSKVDDVKDALADASASAKDTVQDAAKNADKAAKKGLKDARKKSGRLEKYAQKATKKEVSAVKGKKKGKGLITLLILAAIAGAGYVFWKRSQPVDDPWAEEYWEDIDLDDVEDDAKDKVDEAADVVKDKVEDAKQAVQN